MAVPEPLMDAARAWQHEHQPQPGSALAAAWTPVAGQERPAGWQCLSLVQQYNVSAELWVLALLILLLHDGDKIATTIDCLVCTNLSDAPAMGLLMM